MPGLSASSSEGDRTLAEPLPETMRAATRSVYGGPEVLRLVDVPVPRPQKGEVLVRVRAVSLNASDWEGLRGSPAYVRVFGLSRPRFPILGSDIAGVVTQTGEGVTDFRVGDEVFGDLMGRWGGFAEYAVVPSRFLAPKPPELSFEVAAAIPQAAAIASAGIFGQNLQPDMRVLLVGAGGGSGALSIQMAKQARAHVTSVDNGHKLAFMRDLGADEVIDYERSNVLERPERYDFILDLMATRSIFQNARLLRPQGRYLLVGGTVRSLLQTLFFGPFVGLASGKSLKFLNAPTNMDAVERVAACIASGTLSLPVDGIYPLKEVRAALSRHGKCRALGKIVVTP